MKVSAALGLLVFLGCASPQRTSSPGVREDWLLLENGLELGFLLAPQPVAAGDGLIRALRIDPQHFDLRLLSASALDGQPHSARQWCEDHDLVAALNASMYQADYLTSVSLMRTQAHTNNARLTRHRSVLAFDRLDPGAPPVKIIDLECEDFDEWRPRYGSFVQSIRMLSCAGENVWQQQSRKWSTAAVGIDGAGRVLFVHVRSPFTTHDLIDVLIDLPLDLRSLMYTEGGPQAQLYVRGSERDYEFVGSFEKAFGESDDNHQAWPVPNVIGIARKK